MLSSITLLLPVLFSLLHHSQIASNFLEETFFDVELSPVRSLFHGTASPNVALVTHGNYAPWSPSHVHFSLSEHPHRPSTCMVPDGPDFGNHTWKNGTVPPIVDESFSSRGSSTMIIWTFVVVVKGVCMRKRAAHDGMLRRYMILSVFVVFVSIFRDALRSGRSAALYRQTKSIGS